MSLITALALVRIALYAGMATYCALHRRWWAWGVFCGLILATYMYGFTAVSRLTMELVRTVVAGGLVYVTLRRK